MTNRPRPQKTIGILGGCSNAATGEYYRLLNSIANERLGGWDIAETLIAGMNFGNVDAFVRADDWEGLETYMDGKVAALAAGGADLLLCVSNTLRRPLEPIAARHGLDLIHIADPTAAAIRAQGLRRVALFGTRPVMEQDYLAARYRDRHGIEVVVPDADDQPSREAKPSSIAVSASGPSKVGHPNHRMWAFAPPSPPSASQSAAACRPPSKGSSRTLQP